MSIYYVYAYLRTDGTPYYIGKGSKNRAFEQHRKNNTGIHTPKDKSRIVFLENNLTNIGALAIERRLIRWYGRKDLGTGILRNLTDGGEGVLGMSQLTRDIMSGQRKGIPKTASCKKNMSNAHLGKTHSNESKIKMSGRQFNCPHCNYLGSGNTMFRWHFDNCKTK
jgi:hypothetical protein